MYVIKKNICKKSLFIYRPNLSYRVNNTERSIMEYRPVTYALVHEIIEHLEHLLRTL